ncbi:MAG: hypothetical protein IJV39_04940 [Ruminococcus sp.]|nr:hypothetical protein [Ruminococcus sp.]
MKRCLSFLLCSIIMCFAFAGCNNGTNDQSTSETETKTGSNLSVSAENEYDAPDSTANIIEVKSTADSAYSDDLSELVSASEEVIRGQVQKVVFTNFEGAAWTKADVLITESLKGTHKKGDTVSVFMLGGYISLTDHIAQNKDDSRFADLSKEQISKTFLKETVDNEEFVSKGADLIMCLVPTLEDSPLPKGAYERIAYAGQLSVDKNGNFIQTISGGEKTKTYSYDDIKKIVKK